MSLQTVLDNLPQFKSDEIIKAFVKGYSIINNPMYKRPICSISGGSDSDVMLDIIHRIDEQKKVTYVWFDTGLEYKATKEHLKYLENRYDIKIHRERAIKPIPLCTRKYGQPFLNKFVSEHLGRLQYHNFVWEDGTFEELCEKYTKCVGSIKFWCNKYPVKDGYTKSKLNINYNKWLKEFVMMNPPTFTISSKCCYYAKKKPSHDLMKKLGCDLVIIGVRKAEGGIRALQYKNCYTQGENQYRPLFWFNDSDKQIYAEAFDIIHSECYERWGFKRTGCVGCPYGLNLTEELAIVQKYEPNLYKAANNVFKESYEYTKQYRQFVREMKDKERGRRKLF